MKVDLDSLRWRCNVCGEERADPAIAVRRADISAALALPPGTVHHHVRYCVDRLHCIRGAPVVTEQFLARRAENHDTRRD